ncbi:MAG: hypothetical protein ACYDH0_00275 [Candidatus Aminicenantales bacterium]
MSVFQCYVYGIREATRRPPMVILLWLANAAFSATAALLFAGAFGGVVGKSARDLVGKTDMNAMIEFLTAPGGALEGVFLGVLAAVALFALASIFLQGGILHVLTREGEPERFCQSFFAGGGRFYGRFFRLALASIVLWFPALAVFVAADEFLKVLAPGPAREEFRLDLLVLRIGLALFLIYFVRMILDYARIRIAARDERRIFPALVGSVRFVSGRLGATLALYYLLGLTGAAAFLVYRLLEGTFSRTSVPEVLLGFGLVQLFIGLRSWLKIATQAAELRLASSGAAPDPAPGLPLPVDSDKNRVPPAGGSGDPSEREEEGVPS